MQLVQLNEHHRIPFYTDVQAGLTTLDTLKTQTSTFKHIVAGHDEIYTSTQQASQSIEYTAQRLESILANVRDALADGSQRTTAAIMSSVAHAQGLAINALSQYVLCQTIVQSALSTLYTRGELYPLFENNQLMWRIGSTGD